MQGAKQVVSQSSSWGAGGPPSPTSFPSQPEHHETLLKAHTMGLALCREPGQFQGGVWAGSIRRPRSQSVESFRRLWSMPSPF